MFDVIPGDVLYKLNKWDQASNTVYTFDLSVSMHDPGCRVNENDVTLFAESYCQQGNFLYFSYFCSISSRL
jgi:hypothetical protein